MGKKKHNKQTRNTEVKAMTLEQELDSVLFDNDVNSEARAKIEEIIRRYEKAAEERTAAMLASNTEFYKDTAATETDTEEPEEKGFKAWFKRNKVKLGIGVAIGLGALLAAALAAGSNGDEIPQLEFDPENNEDEDETVEFDDGLEEQEFEE